MKKVLQMLAGVGVAAALALTVAGPANAATSDVQIRNGAFGTQLLTSGAWGLVSMQPAGSANQTWAKTDVGSGWAIYSQGDQCLTGVRIGISNGFAHLETCRAGDTEQLWHHGASRELQVRDSGLAAQATGSTSGLGVVLGHFSNAPSKLWGVIPAG